MATSPSLPSPDLVKVIFTDIPAGIALEHVIKPATFRFHDFLTLLYHVSSSVIDKLDGFSRIRLSGQGFTLSDGCWWYRIVSPANGRNDEKLASDNTEKGAWKELEDPPAYDGLMTDMTLGLPKQLMWIEVQHNLQRLRDEAVARQAFMAETGWGADFKDRNGPGPAVETPYIGPVIVNGSAFRHISPMKSTSPELEKFPDLEMPDFTYPFVPDPNADPRCHINTFPSTMPPPPYHYSNQFQDNQLQNPALNSYQPPIQTSPHFRFPQDGINQQRQHGTGMRQGNQPQNHDYNGNRNFNNGNSGNFQYRNNGTNGNFQQHKNGDNASYHHGNRYDATHGHRHSTHPDNNFNNRGNGNGNFRGRGRGGRNIPSFTQRPGPFPRQVGAPVLNQAHWADRDRHQREEQEIQNKLNASKHGQSLAKLEAKLDAEYHTSFQTGSPNSGDRVQGNNPGKRHGARTANGKGWNTVAQNHHKTGQNGQGNVRFGVPGFQQNAPNDPYQAFLSFNPQMHPLMANQAAGFNSVTSSHGGTQHYFSAIGNDPTSEHIPDNTTYWNRPRVQFPTDQNYPVQCQNHGGHGQFVNPAGTLIHPTIESNGSNFFPGFGNAAYNSGPHANQNMHFNTDIMKESEIIALNGNDADSSRNQSSRTPSRASSRVFSDNQSVQQSSVYNSFPQDSRQPHFGRTHTLAATYHTADEFSDQLTGQLPRADYENLSGRTYPPPQPLHSSKGLTDQNKNDTDRRAKNKNSNKAKKQRQKAEAIMNNPPKLVAPSGPPVGDFSPPKPREQREERAKKTFENQEKQNNKGGKGTPQAPPDESIGKPKARGRNNKGHKKSKTKSQGSVSFSAAAARNRPSNSRTLSTATLKLGDFINTDADDSDLTELSHTPSLSPTREPGKDLTVRRIRTRVTNQAKEAEALESSTKKLVVKVEEQTEGRKARALRRASERFREGVEEEAGEGESNF